MPVRPVEHGPWVVATKLDLTQDSEKGLVGLNFEIDGEPFHVAIPFQAFVDALMPLWVAH